MIRKYCDKCGKEVKREIKVNFETNDDFNGCSWKDMFSVDQQFELCNECARDVIDFIENSNEREER